MIKATRFAQKMAVLLSRENKKVWSRTKISNDNIKRNLGVDHQSIRKWIEENYTIEHISDSNKEKLLLAMKNILGDNFNINVFDENTHTRDFCAMFGIDPCLCNYIIDTRLYADSALLPSFVYPEETLSRSDETLITNWFGLYSIYRYGLSPEYEGYIFRLSLQVRYIIAPSKTYSRKPKKNKWVIRCRLNVPNLRNPNSPYRYDGFLKLGPFADWVFESRSSPFDFIYMITTAADDRIDNTGSYMSLTQGAKREPRCRPILLRREEIELDNDPHTAYKNITQFMKETKYYNKDNQPPEDVVEELRRLSR